MLRRCVLQDYSLGRDRRVWSGHRVHGRPILPHARVLHVNKSSLTLRSTARMRSILAWLSFKRTLPFCAESRARLQVVERARIHRVAKLK
mmetsp:Transcript_9598/g.23822  ORF Transcript_9598/g.23822 Transcript_9598/m.23822 type:complete len:90 (+) Transcript_9598:179-448(+)